MLISIPLVVVTMMDTVVHFFPCFKSGPIRLDLRKGFRRILRDHGRSKNVGLQNQKAQGCEWTI